MTVADILKKAMLAGLGAQEKAKESSMNWSRQGNCPRAMAPRL